MTDVVDVVVKSVPRAYAKRMEEKGFAELVYRKGKAQIESMKKNAISIIEGDKGSAGSVSGALSKLGIALEVANLAATIISAVIICKKLDKIDLKLSQIQKATANIQDFNFEMQIAHPCRKLIGDYKMIIARMKKGEEVTGEELIDLIRECHNYLISLYNLRGKIPMEAILVMIFTLLPVFANCIMLYYRRHYDEKQGKHALHDDWMTVFEMLSSEEFLDQIQDDMFLTQRKPNRQVNEYLVYHKKLVLTFKQNIEQLLSDLETCGGVEDYEEVMKWSRQYAAQQAKGLQAELEKEYGPEKAEEAVKQAMESIAI